MMQPSSLLMTVCVLGAARMAHGNNVVEEHDGLSHASGIVEVPAGLEASALAASNWPTYTTTTTQTDIKSIRPAWTTLSTLTISHVTTKVNSTIHTTETPLRRRTHGVDKRQETLTILPDGSLSTISHKHKTVTVTPTATHTATVHTSSRSASRSSIAVNTKIIVAQSTPAAAPVVPASIVIPPGISQISMTTINPKTKTATTHTKMTTTLPANKAVIPFVHSTTTSSVSTTKVYPGHKHDDDDDDISGICLGSGRGWYKCHPFHGISKKWLWLLTIPFVGLLAMIPLGIFALRRLRRRRSPNDDEKTTTSEVPSQVVVTDDGRANVGRTAEEGRGRVATPAADQATTQTFTSAPGGKVTTAPAATVEHVETVPQHDGSTDVGSPRGRKPARVPLLMRF